MEQDNAQTSGNGFDFRKKGSYGDAIMPEMEVKKRVVEQANAIHEMAAMGMNRHARRALAKMNGINRIVGSTKPHTK